jgi:hypothetical protein
MSKNAGHGFQPMGTDNYATSGQASGYRRDPGADAERRAMLAKAREITRESEIDTLGPEAQDALNKTMAAQGEAMLRQAEADEEAGMQADGARNHRTDPNTYPTMKK